MEAAQVGARNDDDVFVTKDGSRIPVAFIATPIKESGRFVGSVIAFRDISERKQAEEQIHYLAHHDGLTGLPNRTMLMEFLRHHMSRVSRYDSALALLFIDLDNFSLINDSQGHITGDELLRQVAARFRKEIRAPDILARQGGDEFIVLLTFGDVASRPALAPAAAVTHAAVDVAKRLMRVLDPPLRVGAQEFFIHASFCAAI